MKGNQIAILRKVKTAILTQTAVATALSHQTLVTVIKGKGMLFLENAFLLKIAK